jgi:methyl-accepting chemotaxis protein WspA
MKNFARNLTVKWRLGGFVCFLLILLIGAGLGGLNGMRSVNQALSDVYEHQVLTFEELRDIDYIFQAGIVNTVDKALFEQISWDEALKTIRESKDSLDKKWAYLFSVGDDHTGTQGNAWLEPGKDIITATDEVSAKLIQYFEKADIDSLDIFTDETLYPLAEKHRKTINFLIQDRLLAVKNTYDSSQKKFELSKKIFLLTMLVGILISIVASYLLIKSIDVPLKKIIHAIKQVIKGDLTQHLEFGRHDEFGLLIKGFNQMVTYLRELVGQIQNSGIQVTSSITELAATNKQQEVTANEHAATTSEIAASTTEIAATGAHLLDTMKKVNSLTKNAAYAAEEGQEGLKGIDSTMNKMENATGSIVTKLQILNDKASNIAGVVKTINKVADQTNLLSLNAESAISAAVMGIDKFAEDASSSVKDVSVISEQLSGVIEQVEVLMPQVETLTGGIEAQTQGAKQISDAIAQLNEGAQQTAESLTQTSSSISQLHNAALGLQEGAARFKVEIDDEDAAPPV